MQALIHKLLVADHCSSGSGTAFEEGLHPHTGSRAAAYAASSSTAASAGANSDNVDDAAGGQHVADTLQLFSRNGVGVSVMSKQQKWPLSFSPVVTGNGKSTPCMRMHAQMSDNYRTTKCVTQ